MLEIKDKVRLKQPKETGREIWNLLIPSNQQAYTKLIGCTLTVGDKVFSSHYNDWLYGLWDDCGNEVPFRVFESEVMKFSDEANQRIENEFAALIFLGV